MIVMTGILITTCNNLRQQLFQARIEAEGAVAAKSSLLEASEAFKSEGVSESIRLKAELVSARERLDAQLAKVSKSVSVQERAKTSLNLEDEEILELKAQLKSEEAAKLTAIEEQQTLVKYPDLEDGDSRVTRDVADDIVRLEIGLSKLQRSANADSFTSLHKTEVTQSFHLLAEIHTEKSQEVEAVQMFDTIERDHLQCFSENAQLRSQIVIEAAARAAFEHQAQLFKLGSGVQDAHHALLEQYGHFSHRIVGFEVIVAADVKELGMSYANSPPGHVFVQDVRMGGWAHSAGIRAGATVIALNNEDVERMIPERFQALLHLRPLQIKIVPPVSQEAMDKAEVQLGMLVKSVGKAKNDIESGRIVPLTFKLEGIDFSKLSISTEALVSASIAKEIAEISGAEEDSVEVKLGGFTPLVHAAVFTADARVADLMRGRLVVATTSTGTKPAPLQAAVSRAVKNTQGSSLAMHGQLKISDMEVGLVVTPDGITSQQQQTDERVSNAMAAYHYQEYEQLLGELLMARAETLNFSQTALARGEVSLGPLKEVTAVNVDMLLGLALDNSRSGPMVLKDVTHGGWAAKQGLTPGSVILAINGEDPSNMSTLKLSQSLKNRPLRLLTRTPLPLDLPDVSFDGQEHSNCHEINMLRAEIAVARQESVGNVKVQNAEDEAKFEFAEARRLESVVQFEMNLVSDLRYRDQDSRKDAMFMSVLSGKTPRDFDVTGEFGLVPDIHTTIKDLRKEREEVKDFRRSLAQAEKFAIRDSEAWEAYLSRAKDRAHGHASAYSIAMQVGSDEVFERESMEDKIEDEENMLTSERKASALFRDEVSRAQQSSWREGALADFLQSTLQSLKTELTNARQELRENTFQTQIMSSAEAGSLTNAAEEALKLRREAEELHLEVCTWRSAHPSPVSVPPMEWRQDEKKMWQDQDRSSPMSSPRIESNLRDAPGSLFDSREVAPRMQSDASRSLFDSREGAPRMQSDAPRNLFASKEGEESIGQALGTKATLRRERAPMLRPRKLFASRDGLGKFAKSGNVSSVRRAGSMTIPTNTISWGRKSEDAVLRRVLGPGYDGGEDEYTGPLGDIGKNLIPAPSCVGLSTLRDTAHWATRNVESATPGEADFEQSSSSRQQIPKLQALAPPLPPPDLPPQD